MRKMTKMTPLRRQMLDAMLLRCFAARTQETYCDAVVALAKHYHRPPDTLGAEQLQSYLLFLITKKKLAYASVNQAVCAFRFLFGTVLRRPEVRFDIPMAKVPKRMPQILSREEVRRLIDAAATLRGRTLLTATYAAGLRVSEVCALQLADIESAPDRMCLKVRQGKGGQDRYTLLSPRLLDQLRRYWRDCRPRQWLFPNASGNAPIELKTAQRIYCVARDAVGIAPEGGIHTLRHNSEARIIPSAASVVFNTWCRCLTCARSG